MVRMISFWRLNLAAWPTSANPAQFLELQEKMWAMIDGLIKKGEIEEFGLFPDGISGFTIGKGETADLYRDACMSLPYAIQDVHEIIPYEKSKEVIRAMLKAQIAAAKK